VTYGAGALNMVNAVAAAYAEKSPLVVLSGGPGKGESRSGLLLHHQAKTLDSQFQMFKEITCDQVRLDDAGAGAGRHRARAGQLRAPLGAGIYRDSARHGRLALRAGAARSRARGRRRGAGRLRRGNPCAPGGRRNRRC
jgi:hypothetical protein